MGPAQVPSNGSRSVPGFGLSPRMMVLLVATPRTPVSLLTSAQNQRPSHKPYGRCGLAILLASGCDFSQEMFDKDKSGSLKGLDDEAIEQQVA